MRHLYICLLSLLLCSQCLKAQEEISSRIVLIGNAGASMREKPGFLRAVEETIPLDKKTTVLYLGNNIDDDGNLEALKAQAGLVQGTEATAVFVPGFHEWDNGKKNGLKSVLQQQHFINGLGQKNIKFLPADGCAGPEDMSLGNDAEMVIFDSQWWLHEHEKTDVESDCKHRTTEELKVEFEDIVEDNADKFLLFISHHPFYNKGLHSGSFGIKQHLFPLTDITALRKFYLPLPIVGSLYPLARNAITTKQDINNEAYRKMVNDVSKYLKTHPYVLFAAGQERNLQLLNSDGINYIISSAAGKTTRVRNTRRVQFAEQETGFAVVEILKNKKVRIKYYTIKDDHAGLAYSGDIFDYSKMPPHAPDTAKMPLIQADSFVAAANKSYDSASGFDRFFAGNNYRKDWGTPVKMKVFHIEKEKGGLKIEGLGGGHQSKSLQLMDKEGKKWALRQTNKNLDEVMPEGLRGTVASSVAQDMISSSNPYGSLIVPDLLTAVKVPHATPQVFFVPNDPALGEYQSLFANTVCQLEEREPTRDGVQESENTLDAINEILDHHNYRKDAKTVLKARLVDFLISDFDRHYAQWKWGETDSGDGKVIYPIPKDRDQATFASDGLLIKMARKQAMMSYMQNFDHDIKKVTRLALTGRDVDMFFLNELDEADWKEVTTEVVNNINDQVITNAVSRLPKEIQAFRGEEFRSKLMSRRDQIPDRAMEYYRFISRKVNVLGSNKEDVFRVSGENSGLWVKVYGRDDRGDTTLQYQRWFDPAVTNEVRLYGFNGNDYFEMDEDTKSKIKFFVLGGKGNDTFNMHGDSRNYLYDLSYEDNEVLSKSKTTKLFSSDPLVNQYVLREDIYNRTTFPAIRAGINEDDGFLLGVGIERVRRGFRDSTNHKLWGLVAVGNQAFQLRYKGDFVNFYRNWDLQANAEYVNPVLSYFFGLGNESFRDESKPIDFYRARYNYGAVDLLLKKRFLNRGVMSLAAGPTFFSYKNNAKENEDRVLETPSVVGLDSFSVNEPKSYAGGKLVFNIDNLFQELWPKKGLEWKTELTMLQPLNSAAMPFSSVRSDLTLYATLSHPSNLIAVIRAGGGQILSDSFEYFQAFSLGAHNYLRGFRKNRFAGSSMAYGTLELRWKLFDFNAYVVKGQFGLVGFEELGRVWMRDEVSDKWHNSYGGGIYFTPFNMVVVSAVVAMSPEDTLWSFGVGKRINIIFMGNN
ncbi:MAG: metallophosphoesterase [Flavipsychrobacter sp.]|jgi:hypothetical protein|nr:metallophosphoesterase [Flavipsychrobacter sp.]